MDQNVFGGRAGPDTEVSESWTPLQTSKVPSSLQGSILSAASEENSIIVYA